MSWTREDVINKYRLTLKEISDIEFTSDKTRRLRWRELQKIRKWLESEISKFKIEKEEL
jgi:hypothetical protein